MTGTAVRKSAKFDGTHWSLRSRGCCAVVFACLAVMHLQPILTSAGTVLSVVAVTAAVIDPFAAFLFISASQIAPDPPDLRLTLAQMFVIAWAVTIPFNGVAGRLEQMTHGMRYFLAFIALWVAIGTINGTVTSDYLFAFVFGAISATYVPAMEGHFRRALWMLAAGACLGVVGNWGHAIGLPIVGEVYEQAARGGVRLGSGRGDVNWASVSVGVAMWTLMALLLVNRWRSKGRRPLLFIVASVAVLVGGGAPLLIMGSRGGLAYLVLGGLFFACYALVTRRFAAKAAVTLTAIVIVVLVLGPLLWSWFSTTEAGLRFLATLQYNRLQALQYGTSAEIAGRSHQWTAYLEIIANWPWAGVPRGEFVSFGEYGYATVGQTGAGAGHNVFLDIAAARGIPLAVLFGIGFATPIVQLWRRRGSEYAFPFATAHAVILLAFMNLSIGNFKTYWALHVLTAFAAEPRMRSLRARPMLYTRSITV